MPQNKSLVEIFIESTNERRRDQLVTSQVRKLMFEAKV